MLKNKKAVIFDLDGSLVDSMWIWPSIDKEFIKKYNLTMPKDFQEQIEGMSFTETAVFFHKLFKAPVPTVEEIKQEWIRMCYRKYTSEVPLKQGAYEFLMEQQTRGMKFGIATSNDRQLVEAVLKTHKIQGLFESITTSCEVKAGKPAPDVYLKVASDLGISPSECLVFEDVPMGIQAGKNAGMTVCGVDDAFSKPQEKKKKELADYYIKDYFDIVNHTYEVL